MDYESLYREYQYIEKNLKDQIKGLAKLQKSIAKGMEMAFIRHVHKAFLDVAAIV